MLAKIQSFFGSKNRTENKQNPLERLPVDIMKKIFSYLSDLSLIRATRVSKGWCDLIETHIFKPLCLS